MARKHRTTFALVVAASVGACGGGESGRPPRTASSAQETTTTTSAALTTTAAPAAAPIQASPPVERVSAATAVVRLSGAQCDRQAECTEADTSSGENGRDACMNEVGHEVVTLLPDEQCPDGVNGDSLSACVDAIRAEPCGKAPTSIDSLPSCARERLCARPF